MLFYAIRANRIAILWRADQVLLGYSWEELLTNREFHGRGGRVLGDATKAIAKALPDLEYVVQGRATTTKEAVKVWVYCIMVDYEMRRTYPHRS